MALTVRTDSLDVFGTTYGVDSSQIVVDMAEETAELEPNVAPLCTLLMHDDFKTRQAKSMKVEWREHENLPRVSLTSSDDSGTATAVTIVVTAGTGAYFRTNEVIRMESTGENMLITAISTDTLTVTRGIGGAAVDWGTTNGLTVSRVALAIPQASTLPDIRQVNVVGQYNYTEIHRHPYGMSRTAYQTKMYGGDPLEAERKRQMLEHKRSIEDSLFWGKRDLKQTASRPQGFSGGAAYYITQNITTVGGALTAANLEIYLQGAFRYGNGRLFGFASPLFFSAMSQFSIAKTALQSWKEGEERYGIKAKEFVTGTGDSLILVLKRDWRDYPVASPGRGGSMILLDLDQCRFAPLQSTVHLEDRQSPSYDGKQKEWLTECSMTIANGGSGGSGQGVHAWIRGVTG